VLEEFPREHSDKLHLDAHPILIQMREAQKGIEKEIRKETIL
jgi:hypothetical protein